MRGCGRKIERLSEAMRGDRDVGRDLMGGRVTHSPKDHVQRHGNVEVERVIVDDTRHCEH